ncbi:hypothetical protein LJ707_08960 [Mucilaginibacter sp. UR6-1]|uniref:hypothetical protein n=1 Tax=Mucilaginibacter sp. UR6-1 TaxID=1435643 RepID=UPI001E615BE1|nr:hypothetical protein [Mucilaginibacter sp. UR6-1]MCC8409059.1 hypothetical protein [Mucilaginibacter sp. UR6-1]
MKLHFVALLIALTVFSACSSKNTDPQPEEPSSPLTSEQKLTDSIAAYYGINKKDVEGVNLHYSYGDISLTKYIYLSGIKGNEYWYGIYQNGKFLYQKTYPGYPDTLKLENGAIKTLNTFRIQRAVELNGKSLLMLYKTQIPVKQGDNYFNMKETATLVDFNHLTESKIDLRVIENQNYFISNIMEWYNGTYLIEYLRLNVKNGIRLKIYNNAELKDYTEVAPPSHGGALSFPNWFNCIAFDMNNYIKFGERKIELLDIGAMYIRWERKIFEDVPESSTITFVNYVVSNNTITAKYNIFAADSSQPQERIIKLNRLTLQILNE